jgi:hypothetical protein
MLWAFLVGVGLVSTGFWLGFVVAIQRGAWRDIPRCPLPHGN